MGFFNKTPSMRSRASDASDSTSISGQSTRSSLSKSGSKLKRSELPFSNNTASPNSRLLFATVPPSPATQSPLSPAAQVQSAAAVLPAPSQPTKSSPSHGTNLGTLSIGGSRSSIIMESFEDSSASETESEDEMDSFDELPTTSQPITPPSSDASRAPADKPIISVVVASPPSTPTVRGGKSLAAQLVQEAMRRPVADMKPLGKPLSQLNVVDVALTDKDLQKDVKEIWTAMHLFMNSSMVAAEEICQAGSDHRLYYSVGVSLISVVKSFATFEPDDLESAIQRCKDSITITQLLRKRDGLLGSMGKVVTGSTSVSSVRNMNLVQRHAELIFAECTLLKAVVGIIYSGDFVSFLKEAINMRNAYSIFRTLAKFVETTDAIYSNAQNRSSSASTFSRADSTYHPTSPRSSTSTRRPGLLIPDPSIDEDFRSGVFFGNGLISMILSLLPTTLLKIMEVFGFTGDREYALETLMKGGKWTPGVSEPGMEAGKEGIRRQMCDLALLTYHLVIVSYMPISGVDVPTAENILKYNLERYPNGVFFLYFSGRLNATQTLLEPASSAYHLAIQAQREYIQLQHICHWDLGLISLAGGDWVKAYQCYNILSKESNWSKATYAYAKGVALLDADEDEEMAEEHLQVVASLQQRIVGKSIPLEKFVARRARKFMDQGHRLICPGIELAYVLNSLGMAPRSVLFETHLDQISDVLAELHAVKNVKNWGDGRVYWDDYCLAHLLRGIVLRFIAHPEDHTKPFPAESQIPIREADEQAFISFNNVLKNGIKIQSDHHLVLFAHYELGRLYAARGEYNKAAEQYDLVLSGKSTEMNPRRGKGKVSLQNMVILRSNSGLTTLREEGKIPPAS